MKRLVFSFLVLSLTTMSACGGGAGGTSPSSSPAPTSTPAPTPTPAPSPTPTPTPSPAPSPSSEFSYEVTPESEGMRNISSTEFTELMGVGFNVGNSLDACNVAASTRGPCINADETAWGNPMISEAFIDALKTSGFNAIRLPVAWSHFSDAENFVIDSAWMERVETVVNYALDNDMYVLMNIHWDGGWMQPTNADKDSVNTRLTIMWQQIARRFRDYDDHLLFAGTNEVMVEGDYGTPTEEYYSAQNSFNQTFITTVRATGGRNAYRHLVVQGFNTNIDHTINFAVIPEDVIANRMMMEVHYYDPYNFTLNEGNDNVTQWGATATDNTKVESWANESYVDTQFSRMKTTFYDQGLGLILGEYGVISKTDIGDHEPYREAWNRYITEAAVSNKLVPFYWDNGYTGDHGLGLYNRNTAAEAYPNIIDAITSAVTP